MKKELNFHRGKGARIKPKHLAEAILKLGFTDEQIEELKKKLRAERVLDRQQPK